MRAFMLCSMVDRRRRVGDTDRVLLSDGILVRLWIAAVPPTRMAERRTSLSVKLVAVALSMAVAVLCVEALVRLVGMDRPNLWRPHPELGWFHIPGASMHWTEEGNGQVHINALGMRDVD